jgi:hypothetical protein
VLHAVKDKLPGAGALDHNVGGGGGVGHGTGV